MTGKPPGGSKGVEIFSKSSWKASWLANPVDVAAALNGIPVLFMK